jgi:eukaryotic-like serine/threonine-protein kinase
VACLDYAFDLADFEAVATWACASSATIAMSLVQGRSLAQLSAECAGRDADWFRRNAALLSTVAHAIHYAHQRGVLHRDLKPFNILVDDNNEPKITDVGLAKICESDAGLTRTESLLGSPNYMAPQQAAGPAHRD